ncbi:hypothetical protein KMW28_23035 [Flammeovirga yaeyamensis]|uniref:HEAT repeat domain-containing protein n=1 Tax=Flammeovirga yaeyamensis TaxID=367791 RepID=A0AAX1NCP8_9BACT|nr:hypothetical protein [Flammeovirga yaeyamensis]MBB3696759.1 hypothetical protein [Flammeovirga yaeyamensis]NMF33426.1 hypothetical protein [Flammeovirga yaeyamensis]QWG05299.1 hypothetical protein KMW28_23035 [Flammeovirga yaeyamensis]
MKNLFSWNWSSFFKKKKKEVVLPKKMEIQAFQNQGYYSKMGNLIIQLKENLNKDYSNIIGLISELFNELDGLNRYYNAFKFSEISIEDIMTFKSVLSKDDFLLVLKIASFNWNGYVRELAVLELTEIKEESVLPFIIYRLGDWVSNVRSQAKNCLIQFLNTDYTDVFLKNIVLFDWIMKVERVDLTEIRDTVISFLLVEQRQFTISFYKNLDEKSRAFLAKKMLEYEISSKELEIFINDKNYLIRILALKYFGDFSEEQIQNYLHDSSYRVRLETISQFINKENYKEILIDFIADTSGSIRQYSRYYLRNEGIDFKEIYIKNLGDQKDIVGSLLGLLDINANDYVHIIKPYLNSEVIKIKKTAFFVYSSLIPEEGIEFAILHLDTKFIGLRNQIIDFFSENKNKEALLKARVVFKESEDEVMQLSMLKLMSRYKGLEILRDLLLATIHPSINIRKTGNEYLKKWKIESTHLYQTLNEEDQQKTKEVFELVYYTHVREGYFYYNPAEGIDFYIK